MDKAGDENYIYEDAETSFSSSNSNVKLTRREIIISLYNQCLRESAKELVEGGIMQRYVDGELINIIVPNQKEIIINNISSLRIACLPYLVKSKKPKVLFHKERFEESQKKIREDKDKRDKEINNNRNKLNSNNLRQADKIKMYNDQLRENKDYYELLNIESYKELLICLTFLLDEHNFFEEK
jgi:vacuolar-type H+-ATPase subunit I/STV1|tara:strand:+ start:397 stop:945 length:549 start_codon:yes stop_codon:yes gene_type:complete